MGAYDDAARDYLAAGWAPIPVRGKSMPVKGATGYDGTVTAEKVDRWLDTDLDQRARAKRGVGMDSIALRHRLTIAIDVDQGYGNKGGVAALAAWAEKRGLPPLPATWSSTARGDDSPSRQYVYRIPDDVTFKTKPCDSVELCTWHHRFTVCAPTVHPETRTPYTWYAPKGPGVPPSWGERSVVAPTPADVAMLPEEWFAALRGGVANVDKTVDVVDLPALFASFAQGPPDRLVDWLIAKWSDEGQHVGHDEFKNALLNCLMVGREGHPGVEQLYRTLTQRYTAYLAVARPDVAATEVRSLVAACATIAQQKPARGADHAGPPLPEPVDTETWGAFVTTFTDAGTGRMANNRTTWLREALAQPAAGIGAFHRHAVAAFGDVVAGRYSATTAVQMLTNEHARSGISTDIDLTLRACLAAALSHLERASA